MGPSYLFLVSFVAALAMSVGQECTQQNYDRCTARVRGYMGSVIGGIVPTVDPEYLDAHCGEWERAFSCVEDFLYTCHYDTQTDILAIAHAYSWICEDGMEDYREYATCLHRPEVTSEGRRCNNTFHQNVDDLVSNPQPSTSPLTLICKYVNDYLDCVQNAVQELCSREAGVWMREFDTRLLQPTYEGIGCTFHDFRAEYVSTPTPQTVVEDHYHDDNHYGVIAFLIVLLLILSAALIFSCVMFIVMRRRLIKQITTPSVAYNGAAGATTRMRTDVGAPVAFANPLATPAVQAAAQAPLQSTQAPPLPQKSPYTSHDYSSSGNYVQFENEPEETGYTTATSQGYTTTPPQSTNTSPEEVDITSGVGGYDLRPELSLSTGVERVERGTGEPVTQPERQNLDNPIYDSTDA